MTIEEIRQLFYEVSMDFWNAVDTILYPDSGALGRLKILSYLNENGFYLPNLFPQLGLEDLFLTFYRFTYLTVSSIVVRILRVLLGYPALKKVTKF